MITNYYIYCYFKTRGIARSVVQEKEAYVSKAAPKGIVNVPLSDSPFYFQIQGFWWLQDTTLMVSCVWGIQETEVASQKSNISDLRENLLLMYTLNHGVLSYLLRQESAEVSVVNVLCCVVRVSCLWPCKLHDITSSVFLCYRKEAYCDWLTDLSVYPLKPWKREWTVDVRACLTSGDVCFL